MEELAGNYFKLEFQKVYPVWPRNDAFPWLSISNYWIYYHKYLIRQQLFKRKYMITIHLYMRKYYSFQHFENLLAPC
jgi:hypothetical protein